MIYIRNTRGEGASVEMKLIAADIRLYTLHIAGCCDAVCYKDELGRTGILSYTLLGVMEVVALAWCCTDAFQYGCRIYKLKEIASTNGLHKLGRAHCN